MTSGMPFPSVIDSYVRHAGLGENAAVIAFLNKYPQAIDEKDNIGWSALMEAAALGRKHTVTLLLDRGADINQRDNDGWTVLMRATWNRHQEVIEELLTRGADFTLKDSKGKTAYDLALQHCETPIVLLLRDWPEKQRKIMEEQQARAEAEKARQAAADIAAFSPSLKRRIPAPRPLRPGRGS